MSSAVARPEPGELPERPRGRRRDRRAGLAVLLASLVPLLRRADATGPRVAFEETTRRIVGAEQVRIREGRPPAPAPAQDPSLAAVVYDIPGDPARPMYLEAVRRPARRFDEWDLQLLALASQLAALLLDAERARGARAAAPPLVRDGAAPLIGSTAAMRTLRQTVERVAVTDFTILIEGGTGPQAHPHLGV